MVIAESETPLPRRNDAPTSVIAFQLGLVALAVAAVPLADPLTHWSLVPLLVIAGFTIIAELIAMGAEGGMSVSGSFLGLILAAVILGGVPAAAIGALTIGIGAVRRRSQLGAFVNDLLNYTWCPLAGGLFFHGVIRALHLGSHDAAYYLIVFATYAIVLMLNFVVCAGYRSYLSGISLPRMARDVLVPTMPAELLSALLLLSVTWVGARVGSLGLALVGISLLVFQNVTQEMLTSKRRSEALARSATTDELTGLANRERFRTAIDERIERSQVGHRFAVLLMDLDRFKEINDTLGHDYGDRLLRDLGPRLVEAVGNAGMVARLGGDEFGILLGAATNDLARLESAVARLLSTVAEPFFADELSLEVGASVGVAWFPQDGGDAHALLRCADIAMYAAKDTRTDYQLYAADQNHETARRLSVLSGIRGALAGDEIVVHYQPIVDLEDLSVKGAEGLVRWEHPEHGLIPPGAFVETVEQTGLIGPLTRHVLEHAITECAEWRRGGGDLSVAVNLSVGNLLDRDLPRDIERMLDAHHMPADALRLEITESMIMTDPDRALATVGRLSDLGVRLSVDDFGTGYSSLANLRRLPIDELKIDRSFVSPMLQDESDLIIVRSTINLGHDLGLRVIAEGVEDAATLERLARLGCDLAQGYHLSRPLSARAFARWLAQPPLADARAVAAGGWTSTGSGLVVAAPQS